MKCWVFDLDGTLVDSAPQYFEILRDHFQIEITPELHKIAFSEPADQFFKRFYTEDKIQEALTELSRQCILRNDLIKTYDRLHSALTHLKSKGLPVCVWTNRDKETALHVLESNRISPLVDHIVSGSCVQKRKPHPDGLHVLLSKVGISPQETTVVGDHDVDMLGAKAAGARAVRALWHGRPEDQSCDMSHFQFHNTHDFEKWIEDETAHL